VSGIGKGGLRPEPPLNVDWDLVRKAVAQAEDKPWSDKVATKNIRDPACPKCGGPCAAALIGLWCVICGARAYG